MEHWSAKLLSYGGRVQLIKSVLFAVTNYLLQCFPLPKSILRSIEAVCRSFLWSNSDAITKKSHVAWEKVCLPKKQGGLQVIDLTTWSRACLLKLLWNLSGKQEDSVWVKWIHGYYMPLEEVFSAQIPKSSSWIMKGIMKCRVLVNNNDAWDSMQVLPKYKTGVMYNQLRGDLPEVNWKSMMFGSIARPRAQIIVWLACHGRLATKERLYRFGMLISDGCCFCSQVEALEHLLFECNATKVIWQQVLLWLKFQHTPGCWSDELHWVLQHSEGKNWRAKLLKIAFLETVYEVWKYRNAASFGTLDRQVDVNIVINRA